ncbi:ethylene-responsive transcription factor ERF109-like [Triticum urartu]|uniref:ethylene-responsive transcription factor ERF109-like n=1 Tax=Triticum urartu TaxID=4572 RepID=UPI0020436B87|nr:ethylene-responsive transcription factor ERF109-like [Triticum urartu]
MPRSPRAQTQPHALSSQPRRFATSPLGRFPRHHRATMPPRRWCSSGHRGVRERPNGWYSAEIRSGDVRLGFGSFRSAYEAARAYHAAAWRLDRPRSQMNFRDVFTREHAQRVAPPPRLITDMDRADHARRCRRLLIAKEDERAMAKWRRRHPEDVADERAY